MSTIAIINAICNLVISTVTIMFVVFVFGRFSVLDKISYWQVFLLKLSLCMLASGSLFLALTTPNPSVYELILDIGLAYIMTWASIFHYRYFVKKSKNV